MPIDRFLIAPYDKDSGKRTDLKPWLISDQAFSKLDNAYVFRGRVRKRFGSRWLGNTQFSSRLRVKVGTLNVPISPVPTLPGAIGQMFSIGEVAFTVNALGTPAVLLVANGSATTKTFNTTTGAFAFAAVLDALGVPLVGTTSIFWYPALPVMGLRTYQQPEISDEVTFGFDTKYAYQYINSGVNTGWERVTGELTAGAATWTGSNSQFFWTASFGGANAFDPVLFVTNFNETEPNFMRVYSNTVSAWDNFRPLITAANTIDMAKIIVPYKNRLLLFNTWENEAGTPRHYPFRVRYCAVGSALAVDAWREDIPGKGSGIDCPSNEAIVTVEFIRDRLIVFMEASTWEIAYTGNQIYPFAWQQINTELGAESTFSVVPFDKVVIGVGNVGIHSCNGTSVDRIDAAIPDEVFNIHNIDGGVERVYGIRDYFVEMIYWTFPDTTASADFPFPKKVLVYNYKTGTWAFNDDSITAFGYFQPKVGVSWDSTEVAWDDPVTWNSGQLQSLFRNVIAGNQQGWTFLVDADTTTNSPALQITNITTLGNNIITITAINHNLSESAYVYLEGINSSAGNFNLLNNGIYNVIFTATNPNTFTIAYEDDLGTILAGTYSGGGVISLVSKIDILTKEYSFYIDKGRNAYVSKVDFQVDRTDIGEVIVDYYVSTNTDSMVALSKLTNCIVGNNILETSPYESVPFETEATRLMHPIYIQGDGEFIQLQITMSDEQMTKVFETDNGDETFTYNSPAFEDFQLHSITIFAQPSSSRNQ